MRDQLEQRKFYYASGKVEAERSYKNGIPHGCHRGWYENGVLASEVYYNNGVPEGDGKQWDKGGNLLFTYTIRNGTGIQKVWFENQGIWGEVSWLDGKMTGRQRTYWIDDGTVVGDTFWIENESVSRKKYDMACKADLNLPRYNKNSEKVSKQKKQKSTSGIYMGDKSHYCLEGKSFILDLLASGNAYEALAWLKEGGVSERSLGEAQGIEASLFLVKSLYEQGAKKVWVFDVDENLTKEQNSGLISDNHSYLPATIRISG